MTIGRRRGAAAALLLVAGVLMSACSDAPEPELAPPPSSPSATEPVAEPVKEPWERKTKAGAVAFAKHWMATFSEAMNSGETGLMKAASADGCITCTAFMQRIEDIRAKGGSYSSPGWRILRAVPVTGTAGDERQVVLRVLQGRERLRETANAETVSNPASRATYTASLSWAANGWKMAELRLDS